MDQIPTSSDSSKGVHEQQVSAGFRGEQLTAVPSDVLTLKNVIHMDLSVNQITRFPGELVASELLRLEVLLIHENLLFVLEDLLALSISPRLRELNLLQNPLRLMNNRIYLLEAFFGMTGCSDSSLLMSYKDDDLKQRWHGGSRRGNVKLPSMKYCAKLPRRDGFPMLQRLNDQWITDGEIAQVECERGHAMTYFKPPAATSDRNRNSGIKYRSSGHKKKVDAPERHLDGSRMTVKQMLRNEARSVAIPLPRVVQRFQFDVEADNQLPFSDSENEQLNRLTPEDNISDDISVENQGQSDEHAVIVQLFGPQLMSRGESIASIAFEALNPKQQTLHHQSSGEDAIRQTIVPPESQFGKGEPSSRGDCNDEDDGIEEDDDIAEPWNFPISTFDLLGSEDRHYVRHKSKQIGGTLERDDEFFHSSIFLDCVAQSERSRRLTVRAVDLLCQRQTQSTPVSSSCSTLPTYSAPLKSSHSAASLNMSEVASSLIDNLNANFTKKQSEERFAKLLAYQEKSVSVGEFDVPAALTDLFEAEHVLQKQKTNQLVNASIGSTRVSRPDRPNSAAATTIMPALEASIEDSLSRLKLRNAVDLANSLLDGKQQKRMMQVLIDADERVIEEERIATEQASHRHRLHLINTRKLHAPMSKSELKRQIKRHSMSPWQERNWLAAELQRKQRALPNQSRTGATQGRQQSRKNVSVSVAETNTIVSSSEVLAERRTNSSQLETADARSAVPSSFEPKFRLIETVETAAKDRLLGVNSHDLLVRCAEIRQQNEKQMKALAHYRNRFLDDEAEWEHMRQDPINVVRQHLKRNLFQDAQEVQIGSTQYSYSSLFQ